MSEPYGAKGCSCFSDDLRWWPNARCRFHGILADYTADRRETGTYRVVPEPVPMPEPGGDECPTGFHSVFDPCPGGCLNEDDELEAKERAEEEAEREFVRTYANHTWNERPKKREHGLLAAVRRWSGRIADLLDSD